MPVQVDGTQKDQLCQLLHHLNEMIILREHMNRDAQLLAPGPTGVEGGFVRKFWLLLDWISVGGGTKPKRERGFTPVMSVTRLSSLCQRLASNKFCNTVHSVKNH